MAYLGQFDSDLPFARCPQCKRRYPCSMWYCRVCGRNADLAVVEPHGDGTLTIHPPNTLSRAQRYQMAEAAKVMLRDRGQIK